MKIGLLRRNKSKVWYARIQYKGRDVWRSTGETEKGKAQIKLPLLLKAVEVAAEAKTKGPESTTADGVFEAYRRHVILSGLNEQHKKNCLYRAKEFLDTCAVKNLSDITPAMWDAFLHDINSRLAKNTVKHYFSAVRKFIRWSMTNPKIRTPYLDHNPLAGIHAPKAPQMERPFFEPEVAKEILKFVREKWPGHDTHKVCALMLQAGTRPEEIRHIDWRHISFTDQTIIVKKPKTNTERTIFFSESLKSDLEPYKKDTGLVINSGEVPSRYHWEIIKKEFNTSATPYAMRHTYITMLLRAGVDLKTVMELAGHDRIETTARYLHSSSEVKRQAGNLIIL